MYSPLSPDDEFIDPVKRYIKSKAAGSDYKNSFRLTVMSKNPIDEKKFRSAVSNWIKDEKAIINTEEKKNKKMFFGLLVFGSIMFTLSLALIKKNQVLQYSILPIIGSLALSRAVRLMILEMPIIRAEKQIINEMANNNVITFKYDNNKDQI